MERNKKGRKSLTSQFGQTVVKKPTNKGRKTEFSFLNDEEAPKDPNATLFETLMSDPIKRKMVMELLSSEKEAIEEYKRKEELKATNLRENINASPVNKVKRKFNLESPTALLRRRAIQQQQQQMHGTDSDSSNTSEKRVSPATVTDFANILKGVTVFVEVKSKNEDRSAAVKSMVHAMGATVRDTFTNDVTHVIFKDGSFTTYQRAKLQKKHLVSVLWVESVRTSGVKVPEKNYPALGTNNYDMNISTICDKFQNDLKELVREENRARRSLSIQPNNSLNKTVNNTSNVQRRKTGVPSDMISIYKMISTSSSSSSFHSLEDIVPDTQEQEGSQELKEVIPPMEDLALESDASANSRKLPSSPNNSLQLVESDDSDCGIIDGNSFTKKSCERLQLFEPQKSPAITVKKKRRTLYTEPQPEVECGQVFKEKSLENVTNNKSLGSLIDKSLGQDKNLDIVDMDLTGNLDTKRKVSLESTSTNASEDFGRFVTKRKTRGQSRVPMINDEDGFKIPTVVQNKSVDLSSLHNSVTTNSTNVSSDARKKISSGTEDAVLSLRISEGETKETLSSVELSSLRLSTDNSHSPLTEKTENKKSKSFSSMSSVNSSLVSDALEILDENIIRSKTPITRNILKNRNSLYDLNSKNLNGSKQGVETPKRNNSSRNSVSTSSPSVATSSPFKGFKDSSDTSNNIDSNTNSNSKSRKMFIKARREMELSKMHSTSSSEENDSKFDEAADKPKRKMRRLYNLNQSLSEILNVRQEDKNESKQDKSNMTFKKPNPIPLTPILLTENAKKRIDKRLNDLTTTSSEDDRSIKVDKPKKVVKTKQKKVVTNPECDEQKDLLKFVQKTPIKKSKENNENTPLRKSSRKIKPTQTAIDDSLPIKPQFNRRSTMEFMPIRTPTPRKTLSQRKKVIKKSSIVCTRFHKPDVLVFQDIVKKLGCFNVENIVTDSTSHLVVAECSRTINILRAMARGIWLLKSEWLYASLESGKWLPEESYELVEFSPAVQQCRLQRESFGPLYSMDIFQNCGLIYVVKSTTPTYWELEELIKLCKGKIAKLSTNATIVVGEFLRLQNVICVKETWVLDCITFNELKDPKEYLLKPLAARKSDNF